MPRFGEILAELRQDSGMTQKDLAEKMHLASSSISNYETGHRSPAAEFICQAADMFGVTTDYLLGRANVNIPVDVMRRDYVSGQQVETVVDKLLSLDQTRRETLVKMLDDLCFCAKISSHK